MRAPERVADLVAELGRTDLRPGPWVDALFRALVAAAVEPAGRCGSLLDDPASLAAVHDLCARGEAYLESEWARRIADEQQALEDFPYLGNYAALVAFEYGVICAALGRAPRSVAVVGSGPLPLTSVLLHRIDPRVRVTCVDRDPAALVCGARVAAALGIDGLRHVRARAEAHDFSGHDVVIVAALVGLRPATKAAVLCAVASSVSPGALVAARSVPADGRRLLYPRIDASCVPPGLQVVAEHIPPAGVINSLVLLRPRRDSALAPRGG